MMRCARVATLWLVGILSGGAAFAQTSTPSTGSERPFYAELDVAATLGHKSDQSVGGEAGMRILSGLDVFLEGGRMGNVGTTELDARALKIANAVGASSSASYKVNYFDAGVRYTVPVTSMAHPYLAFGVGMAQVTSETVLSVNGSAVPPASLGVQFGSDLNGTERKALIMFGGGATVTFATRYFVDLSYRYGRILPKTSVIDGDVAINTQRAQVGVGVRF